MTGDVSYSLSLDNEPIWRSTLQDIGMLTMGASQLVLQVDIIYTAHFEADLNV